ncbi:MAG: flagellar hook-basal body complex protein [Lachnospiraceae bacterium]|nr:flagellar hook-basal body complex protein [Lachnospiraceae bacterium]
MMRSLYSGVAGLKTHQTRMDVIGNNIANVNTTAFKSSTINFSDLMSQTTQQASGPNATTGTGGTNARQIGLGVKTGAITMNIDGQGSAQSTGNPFDIMITGDNFFVVNNGQSNFFTRDGSFYVDGAGNLAMTSTGYNVMGWLLDETTNEIKQDTVQPLRIMSDANMTYPPEATYRAKVAGILDQNDTDVTSDAGKSVNLNIYDKLGYSYTVRFILKDTTTDGQYTVEVDKILDSENNEVDISGLTGLFGTDGTSVSDPQKISLNSAAYAIDGKNFTVGTGTSAVTYDLSKIVNGDAFKAGTDLYDSSDTSVDKTITVQGVIDLVAKAFGYQGSSDDFLKLNYTDPTDSTKVYTFGDLLLNQAKGSTPSLVSAMTESDTANGTTDAKVINSSGRSYNGSLLSFNASTGAFKNIDSGKSVSLNLSKIITSEGTSSFDDISIDFSDMSMFNNNGTSTVSATSGDDKGVGSGRMLGDMIGVSITQNGQIYASYDNGMTKCLGQIATAAFANNSGLSKEGDNLYSATMNSGEFDGIGVDITASGGYMTTGVLEMSNVDLSSEFTTMITTQRGFQANSRIITVSDTLLEELTNLKR